MFLPIGVLFVALQAPIVGQKLNGPITVPGGGVVNFTLTEGGEFAVYYAKQDSSTISLYGTQLGSGFANQLLFADPAGVSSFAASALGIDVLFLSGGMLRSVPADGHASAIPLSTPGEQVIARGTVVFPSRTHTLYYEGTSASGYSLHSTPLDGSAAALDLAGSFYAFGNPLACANDKAVFAVRANSSQGWEIFATPLAGGPIESLTSGPIPFIDFVQPNYGATSDGSRTVFLAKAAGGWIYELYGVPTDASDPPVLLHPPLGSGGSVGLYSGPSGGLFTHEPPFVFSPDGKSVAFVALRYAPNPVFQLFITQLEGAGRTREAGRLPPGGSWHGPRRLLASWPWPINFSDDGFSLGAPVFDPSGQWIVYPVITNDDPYDGRFRLYRSEERRVGNTGA